MLTILVSRSFPPFYDRQRGGDVGSTLDLIFCSRHILAKLEMPCRYLGMSIRDDVHDVPPSKLIFDLISIKFRRKKRKVLSRVMIDKKKPK